MLSVVDALAMVALFRGGRVEGADLAIGPERKHPSPAQAEQSRESPVTQPPPCCRRACRQPPAKKYRPQQTNARGDHLLTTTTPNHVLVQPQPQQTKQQQRTRRKSKHTTKPKERERKKNRALQEPCLNKCCKNVKKINISMSAKRPLRQKKY